MCEVLWNKACNLSICVVCVSVKKIGLEVTKVIIFSDPSLS